MGIITEYPEVNSLEDNDTLFINKNGELKQIKKINCGFSGGGGGGSTEVSFEWKILQKNTTDITTTTEFKELLVVQRLNYQYANTFVSWVVPIQQITTSRTRLTNGFEYDESHYGCFAVSVVKNGDGSIRIWNDSTLLRFIDGSERYNTATIDVYYR